MKCYTSNKPNKQNKLFWGVINKMCVPSTTLHVSLIGLNDTGLCCVNFVIIIKFKFNLFLEEIINLILSFINYIIQIFRKWHHLLLLVMSVYSRLNQYFIIFIRVKSPQITLFFWLWKKNILFLCTCPPLSNCLVSV